MSVKKPTALRLLQGNPGKQPIPKHEPKPKVCLPRPPAGLDRVAAHFWRRVGAQLVAIRVMTEADAQALEMTARAYAEYRAAVVAQDGAVLFERPIYDRDGKQVGSRLVAHPAVAIAGAAWKRVMAGLVQFGLTPSSRSRVEVAGVLTPEDDAAATTQGLLR